MPDTVKLAFLGDLMLCRGVSRKLRGHPPEWFCGDSLPILRRADAVIANLEALDRAGICHAGAGRTIAEASASRMLDLPGLKVGLIAATDNMREFAATPDSAGTNYFCIMGLGRMEGGSDARPEG